MLYYHKFQHGKSVPYFEKALAVWEKFYPPNDQKIVVTRGNIQVNRMLSQFDNQMQAGGVNVIKADFTRGLDGRKPEDNDP